ncbi:MAG TPA: DUF3108 domain-containing protein [Bacteroidetes bacterium]|nr:hypothetical protein BMS3Bbin04_00297 [bacterium BMS3Bbin04]HDO65242.1 DUF3108 domain-containing protein [Bacteroidota bacterium]HEX04367.1 DUF3108 domain-containing protein [Bacteroidota bacterium]
MSLQFKGRICICWVAILVPVLLILSGVATGGGVPDSLRNPPDSMSVLPPDTVEIDIEALLHETGKTRDTPSVLHDDSQSETDSTDSDEEAEATHHDDAAVAYHSADGNGVEARPCPNGTVYDVPFGVGERLRYYMEFSFVKAGLSEMSIKGVEMVEGRPVYHINSRVKSTKGIDLIYKVRDTVDSWFDVGGLYSQRYERDINEGRYHSQKFFDYDHDTGWVAISNENGPKGITPFLPYSHNIISALYWVRAQELVENTEMVVPVHDLDVQYPLTIKVYGKETIEVPAGTFDCIKVEPVIKSEGLFKKAGRVFVWLTDDYRRLPIRMSTKISVGTIDGDLVEFRLGTPYFPGVEAPPHTRDDEEWDW